MKSGNETEGGTYSVIEIKICNFFLLNWKLVYVTYNLDVDKLFETNKKVLRERFLYL